MKYYVTGNIRNIIYSSPNSPYKVGILKLRETNMDELDDYVNHGLTFTGNMNEVNKEVDYILYGNITNHPRYGIQFVCESYEIVEPTDEDGIVMYLSSGIFKGIGLKTAKKIVQTLGKDTLNEIKKGYECLLLVPGVTNKKARELHFKLTEYEKNQELIVNLNKLGFNTKESLNLVENYPYNLLTIIENDIYSLKEYASFSKLDLIFLKKNDEYSQVRIKALIKYLIEKMCNTSGDTLISIESLFVEINSYFKSNLPLEDYMTNLEELEKDEEVYRIEKHVLLKEFYDTEKLIASNMKRLNSIKNVFKEILVKTEIEKYEKSNNIKFNKDQKSAIAGALRNNLFIISGGPGTGKTTIIKAVVDIYKKLNQKTEIALLAPTGRSSKRLGISVRDKAYTIHKFLKWNKETKLFQVNEYNKSEASLVIVDEASMIDIFLFSSLLKALKLNVKLLLVGDSNQLPSIGPGNILEDLLSLEEINKQFLNEIYRVKEGSFIIEFCRKIKEVYTFDSIEEKYTDFKFIESSDANTKQYLLNICENIKTKNIDIDSFQVLAPMYKGENGIDNLNDAMQSIFNSENNQTVLEYSGHTYKKGDKVIQLVNDMEANVYNGDIGYIKSIEKKGNLYFVSIDYMGEVVEYKTGDFDKFSLAYAISIHKSQGSEYDNVVVILSKGFHRMFYNKLIYTAVTRAKNSLILIGSLDSLNKSITTLYASNRSTLLKKLF